MVREEGFEPSRHKTLEPKSSASANFATRAKSINPGEMKVAGFLLIKPNETKPRQLRRKLFSYCVSNAYLLSLPSTPLKIVQKT